MTNLVVGTVTFNSASHLLPLLKSVQDFGIEHLIYDNASSDGSISLATSFGAHVEAGPTNRGYSFGVNRLLRAATPRPLLLLNPDTLLMEHPRVLRDELEARPATWVAAPRVVYPSGLLQESARRFYTPWTPLARLIGYRNRQPTVACPVDWVIGAAMLIRSESALAIGGWDEGYFLYCEDMDFCRRVRRAGGEIHYVPNYTVVHSYQRRSRRDARNAVTHCRSFIRYFRESAR